MGRKLIMTLMMIVMMASSSYALSKYDKYDLEAYGDFTKLSSMLYESNDYYLMVFMCRVEKSDGKHMLLINEKNRDRAFAKLIDKTSGLSVTTFPNKGSYIAQSQVDYRMILVNPENKVPDFFKLELDNALSYVKSDKNPVQANSTALPHLKELFKEANKFAKDEIILSTAYRSIGFQTLLYNNDQKNAIKSVAKPGYSEHHTGYAFDVKRIIDPVLGRFTGTQESLIIKRYARDYGFIIRYPQNKTEITQIIYEPWHLRYVGDPFAKTISDYGLCMEEWYDLVDKGLYFVKDTKEYFMVTIDTNEHENFITDSSDTQILFRSEGKVSILITR